MEIINDDASLWQSFKAGDKDSFHLIYSRYYPNLFEYGMRIINDKGRVKDSIHDLFIKLWNNKLNLSNVTSIRAYLLVSLKGTLYNELQKSSRKPVEELKENNSFELVFSVESDFIRKETTSSQNQQLTDALNLLTARQKEVIYLRYFEEMNYVEISAMMNISVKAVYKLSARGLYTLRQILNISDRLVLALLISLPGKISIF